MLEDVVNVPIQFISYDVFSHSLIECLHNTRIVALDSSSFKLGEVCWKSSEDTLKVYVYPYTPMIYSGALNTFVEIAIISISTATQLASSK